MREACEPRGVPRTPTGEPEEASEQRRGPDRRKPSLKSFVHGALNPRRRRIRREEDLNRSFLDWHPRRLLVVSALILLLSLVDGLLTLHLVSAGANEVNPFLKLFVGSDAAAFALAKFVVTAAGVITFVLTAHVRIFRVRVETLFYAFLLGYVVLVMYQWAMVQALT